MMLISKDKEQIVSYYRDCLATNGFGSPKALDWTNRHTQNLRFSILEKVSSLEGSSILDVGSGLGGLFEYLSPRIKNFEYLGIDIMPEFVSFAQKKFGQKYFRQMELEQLKKKFDYVFASGSLTF